MKRETRERSEILPREALLESFVSIASEASRKIDLWRSQGNGALTKINLNGVKDVVTAVEPEIENLTASTIYELSRDIPVIGEEHFQHDYTLTEKPQYVVLDPIDGTKQFVSGGKDWSISICAVENGKPVVGLIFMPDKQELFTTIRGKGVFLNGNKLTLPTFVNASIAVSPRQIKEDRFATKILRSGQVPTEIPSVTPKIVAILKGEVPSAVYFPQEGQMAALWDYAASYLLLQEMGGVMGSLSGDDMPFRGEAIIHRKGWLAASSPELYGRLLPILQG